MAESLRGLTRNPMHENQNAVLRQLCSSSAYPHETDAIRRIETHISWVYLTGPFAYKIKKSIKLPYLDFSTLERRERACRDELTLNRRLAPGLYHEVVTIGGDETELRVGSTPAVEFAVKISQFPDGAIADQLIRDDALNAAELVELAEQIAAFHRKHSPSSSSAPGKRILDNLAELYSAVSPDRHSLVGEIEDWVKTALDRISDVFTDREKSGHVRECHGDLHLGNIVRIDGRLIAFDCLEFSVDLRTIDVIDEVAFLYMDLIAHGRHDLAFTFLNRYLELTGDYAGLSLLRVYATHRALVRAKVLIEGHSQSNVAAPDLATLYLKTAQAQTWPRRPRCVITSGLSGSGKTTIASQLIASLRAVHIRSDVERKRLHGLQAMAQSDSEVKGGLYHPDITAATYRHLAALTEAALEGGVDIIIDASFIKRHFRELFHAAAARHNADFVILSCEAPTNLLRTRVTERARQKSDASEANIAVLDHQLEVAETFSAEEMAYVLPVDTADDIDIDQLARNIRELSDQVSLSSTSS